MVRVKRRYIVVKVECTKKQKMPSEAEFLAELAKQVAQSYGDFGVGSLKRAFHIKKHDLHGGYMIIQVRKGVHEMLMSVIPLMTKINDVHCNLNIIHLSGTIRCSLRVLKQNYIMNLRATIGKQMEKQNDKETTVDLNQDI